MDLQKHLLRLEEQFWKGDADFYRDHLSEDAHMVLAEPVGVLTKGETVQAIAGSARWTDVSLTGVRLVVLGTAGAELDADPAAAVLIYKAHARRAGDEAPYSALVSSTYVRRAGSWKLAVHQQTPSG